MHENGSDGSEGQERKPVRGSKDEFEEWRRVERAERTAKAIQEASRREQVAKERLRHLRIVNDPLSRPSETDPNIVEGRLGEQIRVVTDHYGNTIPDTDQSTGIERFLKRVGRMVIDSFKREPLEKPFSKIIEPKKDK